MKRIITILISLIVLAMFWYLGDLSQQTKVIEGAVTKEGIIVINKGNVYLVEDTNFTKEDAKDLLIDEIIGKYNVSKLYISNSSSIKNIENGDKVKIWYYEIQESVPAKIRVVKVEKI
ncbi:MULTISPECIES: DUF3221 domain-containing protein [Bacillaceae]|jgi:hypothetical protein|uniref:Putative membrane protein n=1 Tax=Caldibacillus thermoamylovorans TaxID=35841 RepID=A0A090IQY2_9BACI|nr:MULTISPECIES: DUF3221 domain-containing protein [Bacillaceae]MBU5342767.1 YobA family protein [Caldifermentibacillus hisashii]MCM3055280.1 YobA family protein [Caldibacillus thermoamylovorans]MDL0421154.1 DUF3221 domain-containing protein [Caldibacillus thermoamylovorans]MEC5272673.1 DUF3221 domain-containing protein [Caldifermentibacillus hisashii]PAC34013.1 hypothetical protein CEJ87_15140 [Caldifermentibacillus hisashii]